MIGSLFLAAALSGCPSSPVIADAAADGGSDVPQRDGAVSADAVASGTCMEAGNGQLQVTLELAPGLRFERADVWLAAMCVGPDGERAVRVVHADPTGMPMMIGGLGAGTYVVRASALVSPGAVSSAVTIPPGTTRSVTQLSLAPGAAPIAALRATGLQATDAGVFDAGARVDSGAAADAAVARDVGASDAAQSVEAGIVPQERSARAPIVIRPASIDVTVGTLTAVLESRDANSFYATIRVRNSSCDTMNCTPIFANSAEIRVASATEPLGLAVARFTPSLVVVDREITSVRVILPGTLSARDLTLSVSLFGSIGEVPDAGP